MFNSNFEWTLNPHERVFQSITGNLFPRRRWGTYWIHPSISNENIHSATQSGRIRASEKSLDSGPRHSTFLMEFPPEKFERVQSRIRWKTKNHRTHARTTRIHYPSPPPSANKDGSSRWNGSGRDGLALLRDILCAKFRPRVSRSRGSLARVSRSTA